MRIGCLSLAVLSCTFLFNSPAQPTSCLTPPAGLTSWWRGEGNGLDNEGGNHGTVMGGGGFTNAVAGRGFSFSGSGDDFIALPPNLFPMPGAGSGNVPFSLELWFKTSSGGIILGQQDQPPFDTQISGNVAAMYVGTNGYLYALMFWGAESQLQSSAPVADGNFHHAAITYDGMTEALYLDGTQIGNIQFSQEGYANTYYYQLGTGWSDGWPATPGGWFPFTGVIDEVSFHSRALGANEVRALFQAGRLGKCAPPSGPALVHRYSFNEPAGSLVAEDSLSGSHGLLLFATTNAPYTNGPSDGSGLGGNGKVLLRGVNGYVSFPPRMISWLSNATFEAWLTWNGPSTSVWQRVWDFGFSDRGTNASGFGTNYIIFSPCRGGIEKMGFEETIVNPFGSDVDPNSLILYGPDRMQVGQPAYIAVTYDPLHGLSQLFLNGSLVSSASKSMNDMKTFTDFNNWLGRSQWTRDPFFNGEIDEFRIWDGVLPAQEIASHFAVGPNQIFVRVRPRLNLARSGNEIVVNWTTNYTSGFRLQSAPSLTNSAWTDVTNAVTVNYVNYQVRLPATMPTVFLRLKF